MKDLFLDRLEQAMEMLQKFGHLTHYMDLPDEVYNKVNEIYIKMAELVYRVVGLSPTDVEKFYVFERWYERLDTAGLYIDNKPICADCLTEYAWDNLNIFDYEERIWRSEGHEEFVCAHCGNPRGGRFDPKLNLGSD